MKPKKAYTPVNQQDEHDPDEFSRKSANPFGCFVHILLCIISFILTLLLGFLVSLFKVQVLQYSIASASPSVAPSQTTSFPSTSPSIYSAPSTSPSVYSAPSTSPSIYLAPSNSPSFTTTRLPSTEPTVHESPSRFPTFSLPSPSPSILIEPSSTSKFPSFAPTLPLSKATTKLKLYDYEICPDSESAITSCCKWDGFGARFSGMISIFALAKLQGFPFCQTRWEGRSHNIDVGEMWDFIGADALGPPALDTTRQVKYDWAASKHYAELNIYEYAQKAYWSVPKPSPSFNESEFNIVLHCRRTDASPARFCHVHHVNDCMKTLRSEIFHGKDFHITLYSDEEDESTFDDIIARNPQFTVHYGNQNIKQFFHDMVTADVLIMSGSSIAWAAAVYRGIEDTENIYEVWNCSKPEFPKRYK